MEEIVLQIKWHYIFIIDFLWQVSVLMFYFSGFIESNKKSVSLLHLFPSHPTAQRSQKNELDFPFQVFLLEAEKVELSPYPYLKKLFG